MKFSALNVDFNSASFDPLDHIDPLGTRSLPNERIKFGYPLENVQFFLLSTNLARERLQIDTDLLRIITSTADELSGATTINVNQCQSSMTLNDLEPKNMGFVIFFCYFRLRCTLKLNFR